MTVRRGSEGERACEEERGNTLCFWSGIINTSCSEWGHCLYSYRTGKPISPRWTTECNYSVTGDVGSLAEHNFGDGTCSAVADLNSLKITRQQYILRNTPYCMYTEKGYLCGYSTVRVCSYSILSIHTHTHLRKREGEMWYASWCAFWYSP